MIKRSILIFGLLCMFSSFTSLIVAQDNSIALDAKETKPLKADAQSPDVTVKTLDGKSVSVAALHKDKPVVLVFFRGGWCPICTRHTQELIKAYPKIKEMGAEMVGVSPDNLESSKANSDKNSIPFPIYSDADMSAAKAFGLAFKVDDKTVEKYKGFGLDLEKASGLSHHALPIPAVFIVDKSGKIVFAHSNPDYRQRLDTNTIVNELGKIK